MQPRGAHLRPEQTSESGLSDSQLPIWIGQQRRPDSPLYNMAFAFVLEGGTECPRVSRRLAANGRPTRCAPGTRLEERGGAARRVRDSGDPREDQTTVQDFSTQPYTESLFRAWARGSARAACSLRAGRRWTACSSALGLDRRAGHFLNQHRSVGHRGLPRPSSCSGKSPTIYAYPHLLAGSPA